MTNLGRTASPVIRYRTGRHRTPALGALRVWMPWARLEGGVLGRSDDMITVRGVNVFPAGIEAWCDASRTSWSSGRLCRRRGRCARCAWKLKCHRPSPIHPSSALTVSQQLETAMGLKVPVQVVEAGALPRFEMKASRFIVEV